MAIAGQKPVAAGQGVPEEIKKDARRSAMLSHLLGIFTTFIGPLIIWKKKNRDKFINEQAKEALNFQLTFSAIALLTIIAILLINFGYILLSGLIICDLVFSIMAIVNANKGKHFQYPVSFRFIK
jgi:uncharacterized Tic20 family protein